MFRCGRVRLGKTMFRCGRVRLGKTMFVWGGYNSVENETNEQCRKFQTRIMSQKTNNFKA
jgi:hypothetical protein